MAGLTEACNIIAAVARTAKIANKRLSARTDAIAAEAPITTKEIYQSEVFGSRSCSRLDHFMIDSSSMRLFYHT